MLIRKNYVGNYLSAYFPEKSFKLNLESLPFAVKVILHLSNNMNFDVTITERC